MNKLKIALVIVTFVALIGSNIFWLLVWINSSLDEKALYSDVVYHQRNSESYLDFINRVSIGNSRSDIEELLQTHYPQGYWKSEKALNTENLKFNFTNNRLVHVEKQTELAPNDKG